MKSYKVQTSFRLPSKDLDILSQIATQNSRSLNGQVEHLIKVCIQNSTAGKFSGNIVLDSTIAEKIQAIAEVERRTTNAQIEYALEKFIEEYEKQHGFIGTDSE